MARRKKNLVDKYLQARRLMFESYERGNRAGDNYNFAEYDRQYDRAQRLKDAARNFASKGGVKTEERDAAITGGQWSRKAQGLSVG